MIRDLEKYARQIETGTLWIKCYGEVPQYFCCAPPYYPVRTSCLNGQLSAVTAAKVGSLLRGSMPICLCICPYVGARVMALCT